MLSFSLLYSIPLFEYTKISSFLSNVDGWVFSHFKLFLINHINILVPVLQRTQLFISVGCQLEVEFLIIEHTYGQL